MKKNNKILALLALALPSLTSCINEDLSGCGTDFGLTYNVRLRTNLRSTLYGELSAPAEQAVAERLATALGGVFTDRASDLDLAFYTGEAPAHREAHEMDGSSASYTIYLPSADYNHLAMANAAAEPLVSVEGDAYSLLEFRQADADTLPSHTVGVFAARRQLRVADAGGSFNVDLYMQNSAVALVIDLSGHQLTDIHGSLSGMASAFAVADSTYSFDRNTVIRASRLDDGQGRVALYAACFPSREAPLQLSPVGRGLQAIQQGRLLGGAAPSPRERAGGEASGGEASGGEASLYQFVVYTTENGSITESTLSVSEPLRAGDIKVIKARIGDGGQVVTDAPEVGVSVKLDWKPGGDHDVEI